MNTAKPNLNAAAQLVECNECNGIREMQRNLLRTQADILANSNINLQDKRNELTTLTELGLMLDQLATDNAPISA